MTGTCVNIAGVSLKNPVMTASGTFGSGMEYGEFFDLSALGAVVTKGVASGLQNPGIDVFVRRDLPFLQKYDTRIIVNVCGHSVEEYLEVVERLADENVDMLEINISCPNVKEGGIAFGTDPRAIESITKAVKAKAKQPVIMKLSPNVTDIREAAKAAESGGADALSLINTLTGMKIDIERGTFALANRTGGLSGPAIRPVAVRMVYEASHAVKIPVIGMGGIASAEDALEFLMAGARAVSVGTANFHDPCISVKIADGIEKFLERKGIRDVNEIVGCAGNGGLYGTV